MPVNLSTNCYLARTFAYELHRLSQPRFSKHAVHSDEGVHNVNAQAVHADEGVYKLQTNKDICARVPSIEPTSLLKAKLCMLTKGGTI